MAMGVGEHFLCAGLTENRTRLSRHHPPVRRHHPFPGQGCGWRGHGFPSYSARLSPANGCLGSPSGMTTLPCSAAGIMSPLCPRPTPTSGCNHALSSVGLELLWGGSLCDGEVFPSRASLLWADQETTVCTLPPSVAGRLGCLALLLL